MNKKIIILLLILASFSKSIFPSRRNKNQQLALRKLQSEGRIGKKTTGRKRRTHRRRKKVKPTPISRVEMRAKAREEIIEQWEEAEELIDDREHDEVTPILRKLKNQDLEIDIKAKAIFNLAMIYDQENKNRKAVLLARKLERKEELLGELTLIEKAKVYQMLGEYKNDPERLNRAIGMYTSAERTLSQEDPIEKMTITTRRIICLESRSLILYKRSQRETDPTKKIKTLLESKNGYLKIADYDDDNLSLKAIQCKKSALRNLGIIYQDEDKDIIQSTTFFERTFNFMIKHQETLQTSIGDKGYTKTIIEVLRALILNLADLERESQAESERLDIVEKKEAFIHIWKKNNFDDITCDVCRLYAHISCPNCQVAIYCSQKCLENDLPEHAEICSTYINEEEGEEMEEGEEETLPELPEKVHYCSVPTCTKKSTSRCSKCKQAWYCSTECQKQDWPKHKTECALLARPAKAESEGEES